MLRSDFQADLNMVNHRGGLVRGEESVRTQEKKWVSGGWLKVLALSRNMLARRKAQERERREE